MATLDELLDGDRTVLMDGGMGSCVEDRGVPVRNALWGSYALLTAEGREINDRLHEEFVAAGAEIVLANVHNASLAACREYDPSGDAEALLSRVNRFAVESARRAGPALTGAGLGSHEGPYATASTHSVAENRALHEPQVRVLRDLDVGLIVFETLTTEPEIRAAAELSRESGIVWAGGLTCGEDGRTLAGVPVPEAAAILGDAEPRAIFVQCTPFDEAMPALEALLPALPAGCVAGVYANDGRVWKDMIWHGGRTSPEAYATAAVRWRDAGARVVGGCCGTTPDHVAALREALTRSG